VYVALNMKCHVMIPIMLVEYNLVLPRLDTLTTGGISSAVASVISEEKDKDKRKLNVILHNVIEPTAEDGQ